MSTCGSKNEYDPCERGIPGLVAWNGDCYVLTGIPQKIRRPANYIVNQILEGMASCNPSQTVIRKYLYV